VSGYTERTVQFTPATPFDEPRPKGVSVTALILVALCVPGFQVISSQFSSTGMLGYYAGGAVLAFELYSIWCYWNGRNWARVLVLAVSLLNVAGVLSSILDRNSSLVDLMSHPLRFVQLALAGFLLYWLNTRPLRAWYSNSPTAADLVSQQLEGRLCTAVEKSGDHAIWQLVFEHDAQLTLACPWRLVLEDNLAFASNSAPEISGNEEEPRRLLQNIRVKAVRVAPRTSDLFLTFEMGIELQTWRDGSAGEQWKYSDSTLTVTADSQGLTPHAAAASDSTDDSAVNN
jgi:hypothetical protein